VLLDTRTPGEPFGMGLGHLPFFDGLSVYEHNRCEIFAQTECAAYAVCLKRAEEVDVAYHFFFELDYG